MDNEEVLENEETEEQIDNNEIAQPDLEDPAFVDSVNKASSATKEIANVVAKKALIEYIKRNPMVLAVVIGFIVNVFLFFFFLFILLGMDFDFAGEGNKEKSEYSFNCSNVYVVWENEEYIKEHQDAGDYVAMTNPADVNIEDTTRYSYNSYNLENYISGIVWNDNNSAGDVKNKTVYELMGIAARSRVVASLSDNCVVLRDYNPENFIELKGNEHKYQQITSAISNSAGVIIGKNNTILDAKYDAFSYTKKSQENEPKKKKVGYYYMMNESVEGQQLIPASWVVENKITTQKVDKSNRYKSMSLYGAKYLLEKADSQYDLHRVLRYYYGSDIKYYTVGTSNSFSGSGCMWWPIGSNATTVEDGVIYAKGAPATTTITSNFGTRAKPTAGASTNHQAIDIGGGVEGVTNIIAASDGTVIAVNTGCVKGGSACGGGLGNYVKIKHSDGTITRYGHMFSVSVKNGATVRQGQVIGKMGSTGVSTGVHLDFQVIVNGTPVNPLNYVSASDARKAGCDFINTGGYTGKSQQDFINFISPAAVKVMHEKQILASITIAQAALESGWGTTELASKYNNYFGHKAFNDWSGPTVELPTKECDRGGCYSTVAKWRVYDSPYQSINAHGLWYHNNGRYKAVIGEKDYVKAIKIIHEAGYATDPLYQQKVINIIKTYNLNKFDGM